jgi:hypothetical protein
MRDLILSLVVLCVTLPAAAKPKPAAAPPAARAPHCPPNMVLFTGGIALLPVAEVGMYCLDTSEVTTAAYAQCVKEKKCTPAAADRGCNQGVAGRADHPINCVTQVQASEYCAWAKKRLPTEDEWRWAAQGAGKANLYPWGNERPGDQACWAGAGSDLGAKRVGTCRVGSYPKGDSPQGIKDLAGNVWEWTSSRYRPGEPEVVARGGSWGMMAPSDLRNDRRQRAEVTKQNSSIGFRCAADEAGAGQDVTCGSAGWQLFRKLVEEYCTRQKSPWCKDTLEVFAECRYPHAKEFPKFKLPAIPRQAVKSGSIRYTWKVPNGEPAGQDFSVRFKHQPGRYWFIEGFF